MLLLVMMVITIVTILYFSMRHKRIRVEQEREREKMNHEKQQDILKAIINTQEQERNRIAANLHDSVGAELSMIKLNLSKYKFQISDKNIPTAELDKQLALLDENIEAIRSICRDLYPVSLRSYGFIRTFEELASKINSGTGIVCRYKFNLKEEDLFPELESKLGLLRIFQEVVSNLIKYAQCKVLDIGFMKYDDSIKILLRHDGRPFTNDEVEQMISIGKGVGLASIKNRINMMNGRIDYSPVNKGSEIIIQLPIHDHAGQKN